MLPIPKTQPDSWQEALKFINHCPICNQVYKAGDAKLFAKDEAVSMVHIACNNCQSLFMAMILTFGQGLSSVGMVTDLNFEDARRLYRSGPILLDEVIDGYRVMQNTLMFNSLVLNGK